MIAFVHFLRKVIELFSDAGNHWSEEAKRDYLARLMKDSKAMAADLAHFRRHAPQGTEPAGPDYTYDYLIAAMRRHVQDETRAKNTRENNEELERSVRNPNNPKVAAVQEPGSVGHADTAGGEGEGKGNRKGKGGKKKQQQREQSRDPNTNGGGTNKDDGGDKGRQDDQITETRKMFNAIRERKDKKGMKICLWNSIGTCTKGDQCPFSHADFRLTPKEVECLKVETKNLQRALAKQRLIICRDFNTPNGCPRGDRCRFRHVVDPNVTNA